MLLLVLQPQAIRFGLQRQRACPSSGGSQRAGSTPAARLAWENPQLADSPEADALRHKIKDGSPYSNMASGGR
jgi:hypothetical protein